PECILPEPERVTIQTNEMNKVSQENKEEQESVRSNILEMSNTSPFFENPLSKNSLSSVDCKTINSSDPLDEKSKISEKSTGTNEAPIVNLKVNRSALKKATSSNSSKNSSSIKAVKRVTFNILDTGINLGEQKLSESNTSVFESQLAIEESDRREENNELSNSSEINSDGHSKTPYITSKRTVDDALGRDNDSLSARHLQKRCRVDNKDIQSFKAVSFSADGDRSLNLVTEDQESLCKRDEKPSKTNYLESQNSKYSSSKSETNPPRRLEKSKESNSLNISLSSMQKKFLTWNFDSDNIHSPKIFSDE
ncbi:16918_t:CDS:1, partial [Acaulospora colombiana]